MKEFVCRPYKESVQDILAALRNLGFFALYSFLATFHFAICHVTKSHWYHYLFTGIVAVCAIREILSCALRLRRLSKELN